jgi:hypothetical protein
MGIEELPKLSGDVTSLEVGRGARSDPMGLPVSAKAPSIWYYFRW